MSDPEGLKIARQLIAEEATAQTGWLDLGRLGLTEVPSEIATVPHLTGLVLGNNWLDPNGEWQPSENSRDSNALSDLGPLFTLSNLTSLFCDGTSVSDLRPLAKLCALNLFDCESTQVGDLSPLASLQSLNTLYCRSTQVSDLSPLASLQSLNSLSCRSTQVSDLSPLASLQSLNSLSCRSTQVSDLSPLASLQSLNSLDCRSTQVSDLSPLASLQSLNSLSCSSTPVSDLSPLASLQSLNSLDCRSTQVSDLSPLASLQSLNSLSCSSTQVSDLSPLASLQSLNTLECSSTPVSDLSPLASLQSLNSLDCSFTQVSDLSPLASLQSLNSLDCSFTQVSDLSPLASLQSLNSLDCSSTPVSDLSPLASLQSLNSLDCSFTQVSDLSPLASLQSLNSLDCRSTQVSDLSPLASLQSLNSLSCSSTQVSDLSLLASLQSLNSLDCRSTQVSDLSPLASLQSLNTLECSSTPVSDLSPLASLQSLNTLECSSTPVSDLSPLASLQSLNSLDCSFTQVSDLSPLASLQSLNSLHCRSTQVSDLSPLISTSVERAYFNNCHIQQFPEGLLAQPTLQHLSLFESTVSGVPADVLSQGSFANCLESLRSHFADLQAGAAAVPDAKLVVLGNGRIGKTQICRRLRGEPFDESVPSTHGITVTQTPLAITNADDALLNIWDFGGQDLYHGTHALFMKTRAIFLIVWVPQYEDSDEYEHSGIRFRNHPLPYWLDYVRQAAGGVCPVIILQNQCDSPGDEILQLPASVDQLEFPFVQTLQYSAQEDRKRQSLNEALGEAVKHLRTHEGIASIGKGRMKVRRQILKWIDADSHLEAEKRKHRLMSQNEFRQLCERKGDVSSPQHLLEYLHNAGIVFYRQGLFHDQIILDQSWALDAIYTVFHREECYRQLKMLKGRFTQSLLNAFVWSSYSDAEQKLFLSFMESCGVCFVHRSQGHKRDFDTEYVAPDLLPDLSEVQHELAGRWDHSQPGIERRWEYPFLNPALVRNIISRIGRAAGEAAVYWKYGLWTFETNTRSAARLEQQMVNDRAGSIVLQCQGGRSAELLDRITKLILECHESAGYSDVPMTGVPVRRDSDAGIDGEKTPDADPDSPVTKLKFGDLPVSQVKQACVSYAWSDELSDDSERGNKVREFCELLSDRGFDVVRDTSHLQLGDRLSTFMRQMIGSSNRAYIFLSDAYLKSPNCMYELLVIWQSSGDDPDRFLDRIRVLTMPGTDIYSIPARLKYAAYWKQQRDEIQQVIEENGIDVLGPTDLHRYSQIIKFSNQVNEMLAQIVDVLQASDFDEFISNAEQELSGL